MDLALLSPPDKLAVATIYIDNGVSNKLYSKYQETGMRLVPGTQGIK